MQYALCGGLHDERIEIGAKEVLFLLPKKKDVLFLLKIFLFYLFFSFLLGTLRMRKSFIKNTTFYQERRKESSLFQLISSPRDFQTCVSSKKILFFFVLFSVTFPQWRTELEEWKQPKELGRSWVIASLICMSGLQETFLCPSWCCNNFDSYAEVDIKPVQKDKSSFWVSAVVVSHQKK